MTIVVYEDGLVITDSARVIENSPIAQAFTNDLKALGVDPPSNMTKGQKFYSFDEPIHLKIPSEDGEYSDWFYAYAGTGVDQVIAGVAKVLQRTGSVVDLQNAIITADELSILDRDCGSAVYLYGYKGTFFIRIEPKESEIGYTLYGADGYAVCGSGCLAFERLSKESPEQCPVRRVVGASIMEPSVGGPFQVWQLPTEFGAMPTLLQTLSFNTLMEAMAFASSTEPSSYIEVKEKWLTSIKTSASRCSRTTAESNSRPSSTSSRRPPKKPLPQRGKEKAASARKKSSRSPRT